MTHEKNVTILKTGQDFYGRTLAFVVVDGVNVNAEMIRSGMAWQYVQYNDSEELATPTGNKADRTEDGEGGWFWDVGLKSSHVVQRDALRLNKTGKVQ